jgi:hypothetical protein
MSTTDQFNGKIARSYEESEEWWPEPVRPHPDAPNVIVFLLDDVGFAQMSRRFGGLIDTPNIDRLADGGLRYNDFHTLAEIFDIGCDTGTQVDPAYDGSPFPFTGRLDKVTITLTQARLAPTERDTEFIDQERTRAPVTCGPRIERSACRGGSAWDPVRDQAAGPVPAGAENRRPQLRRR